MTFPLNPSLAQQVSFGGRTWQWNGRAWAFVPSPDDGGGGGRSLSFGDVQQAHNPITRLALSETSGTIAIDSSVQANNGTYFGSPALGQLSIPADQLGSSIQVSGSQYVNYPSLTATLFPINASRNLVIADVLLSLPSNNESGAIMYVANLAGKCLGVGVGTGNWSSPGNQVVALQNGNAFFVSGSFGGSGKKYLAIAYEHVNNVLFVFLNGVLIATHALNAATFAGSTNSLAGIGATLNLSSAKLQHHSLMVVGCPAASADAIAQSIVQSRFLNFNTGFGGKAVR